MTEVTWFNFIPAVAGLDKNSIAWLSRPRILSAVLRQCCQQLSVKLLTQGLATADPTEAQILSQANYLPCWIRCVALLGDGFPMTYGRVVVAKCTYEKFRTEFDSLGEQLLGETLLYQRSAVTRSGFEFALIPAGHPWLPAGASALWARRSVFKIDGYPLIVTEFFAPTLPMYPECPDE